MLHRGFIAILAACFLMLESYHATFLSVKRGLFCPLNISQLVVRKNFSYLALLTTQDSRNALQNTHIERVPEQLTKNLVCGWTRFFIASVDHSNAQGQVHSSVWILQMVVMNKLESVCKSIKNRWFLAIRCEPTTRVVSLYASKFSSIRCVFRSIHQNPPHGLLQLRSQLGINFEKIAFGVLEEEGTMPPSLIGWWLNDGHPFLL